jgi:hypothetical protein
MNDRASSLFLASGYSIRLYKDADLLGVNSCFTGSDTDFADNVFEDESPLNDEVSSAEVFYRDDCPDPATCLPAESLLCGSTDTYSNDGAGSTDRMDNYLCVGWNESGPEYTYSFSTAKPRRVVVTQSNHSLDLFVLDGVSGNCNRFNCIMGAGEGIPLEFNAVPGNPYNIVVEGYYGATGSYTINVQCSDLLSLFLPVISKQ